MSRLLLVSVFAFLGLILWALVPAGSIALADDTAPMVWPSALQLHTAPIGPDTGEEGEQEEGPWMGDASLGGNNEPAVAVDPHNPLHVAYASLFQLRVSTDGGVTFSAARSASVPAGWSQCGDASVGYDSQGRLFWTYLGCVGSGIDIFLNQVDPTTGLTMPGYPVNVTASPGVNLPGSAGNSHDKEWLAVDSYPTSPFANRLYISWTRFVGSGTRVMTTSSADLGATWTAAVQLSSGSGEGFVWPVENTVAPNGDVYVGYHSEPTFVGGAPNGTSGRVYVCRSTNGGASFPQKTQAYTAGQADMTFNVQDANGPIPGTQFWLQGSVQPWVLADPFIPGRIYVVENDDPDNVIGSGDAADVFINISNDFGLTWGTPTRVDSGPGTWFQVMPAASIDPNTGAIAVHYYDARNDSMNAAGHYLLDVFMTSSTDGGLTFTPDAQINDVPFNPDPGAAQRYPGPPPTTRIGEYNGVSVMNGVAYAVWCGNKFSGGGVPIGQQTMFDRVVIQSQTSVASGPPGRGSRATLIEPASPNPFNPATTVSYSLPAAGQVRITVHDIQGRRVATLAEGWQESGRHSVVWDGRAEGGASAGAGVYFVQLSSPNGVDTRKVILQR